MRDSLNHIQGNDLGVGWIDHNTDLLLLFALLYVMVNLSDLHIVERRRLKPCLNPRRGYTFADRRSYRSYVKPESCEGTIDVCLACRINGLSELGSSTREILQCL